MSKANERLNTQMKSNHFLITFKNDPSAGSPTETLLRLLLPLNVKVYTTSQNSSNGFPHY